jgi:Flp pilus assembly protein TadD
MSLVLTERNRLATPVELSATPPPTFAAPTFDALDLIPHDGTPDYVLGARQFAENHRDSAAALVQLAQAEQSIGENQAALSAAGRALSLIGRQGDDPLVFATLQVLLGCGRGDLAIKALPRIKSDEVRNLLRARLAIEEGKLDEAGRLLEKLESSDALATQGWIQMELNEYARAIHLFRQAISNRGATAPVLMNLGYAHAALGSRAKAIKSTKQALALAPEDEAIAFNLVSFYAANGDLDAARGELARLREAHPTRLRFDVAEADLYLRADEPEQAYAILRRARQSALWAYAEHIELAELEANLAFVEWRLGKERRKTAAKKVIEQLQRTEFHSLDIAGLLPALLSTSEDAAAVEDLYKSLADVHARNTLLFLETHVAIVQCKFRRATELAVMWAEKEIFSSHAAGVAVYLLADVSADFDKAFDLGTRALRIAGSTDELLNNLAYAYALAGDLTQARELLSDRPADSVFLTATEGLVEVLSGNTKRGLALYDAAYELAQEQGGDRDLPTMVRLNQALALHRAGVENLSLDLPEGWQHHPYWVLFKEAAERAGVSWQREAASRA